MQRGPDHYHFKSISKLMHFLAYPAPFHPLVALVNYDNLVPPSFGAGKRISLDFYKISFKDKFSGSVRYGQGYYDFEEGGMAFLKPRQVVVSSGRSDGYEGYVLYFHADLIKNYELDSLINQYGFFSYDVSEALFLSAKEKEIISGLFAGIATELENNIDQFSQDVLVSQLALILNFSNRFYNRQFITRKHINHQTVAALDKLLDVYFNDGVGLKNGLPTVKYVSGQMGLSARYLSDMLGSLTGLNTQQYIQDKIIEHSKSLLGASLLSISEIAYQLGFSHPQSFSKFFKIKTNMSPLAFRQSFS
jgi:AraC family transcriptional activator of pobA